MGGGSLIPRTTFSEVLTNYTEESKQHINHIYPLNGQTALRFEEEAFGFFTYNGAPRVPC